MPDGLAASTDRRNIGNGHSVAGSVQHGNRWDKRLLLS